MSVSTAEQLAKTLSYIGECVQFTESMRAQPNCNSCGRRKMRVRSKIGKTYTDQLPFVGRSRGRRRERMEKCRLFTDNEDAVLPGRLREIY